MINGAESFDTIISTAPVAIQDEIRAVLNEVIHATFDNLEGKTIQLNHFTGFVPTEGTAAVYQATRMVLGPQSFSHMGTSGALARTMIVNVFSPATASNGRELNGLLSRMVRGGLANLPVDIPDHSIAPRTVVPVLARPSSTVVVEDDSTVVAVPVVSESTNVGGLSEEEQAQIARAIAEFDDNLLATNAVAEADEVRPADPSRVMRLVGDEDEDDLPPFDPSTEADPDIRAALLASRQEYQDRRTVVRPAVVPTEVEDDTAFRRAIEASLAGRNEDEEDQLLSAAIEQSMQRTSAAAVAEPERAIDIDSVITAWVAEGSGDVEQLLAQLVSTGLDIETASAIAEMYM